ncbi:hypothetical protein K439DRAFT_1624921 [Ramaria rubella]|nr:hypothetical protein K439DRAFT_1624921 [Ramaria rubella]
MVNLSAFEIEAAWATGRLNAAAEAATTTAVLAKSIDRETKYIHTSCVTSQDSDKISESPRPSEKMVVPVAQYISIAEEMNKYLTKRNIPMQTPRVSMIADQRNALTSPAGKNQQRDRVVAFPNNFRPSSQDDGRIWVIQDQGRSPQPRSVT